MTTINQIGSVEMVLKMWPRLWTLAKEDAPKLTPETLLQCFLTCLDRGAVFVVKGDKGLIGSCCVECFDETVVLRSLPADRGEALGRQCIAMVKKWAADRNFKRIKVTSPKLCGSTYRYFEKSLGFRRNSVTFQMEL